MSSDSDTQGEASPADRPQPAETDSLAELGRVPYYSVESANGPSLRVQTGWQTEDGVDLDIDAEPELQDVAEIGQAAENWWRRRWEGILQARQQQRAAEQQEAAGRYIEAATACPACGFASNAPTLAGVECPACGEDELVQLVPAAEDVESRVGE